MARRGVWATWNLLPSVLSWDPEMSHYPSSTPSGSFTSLSLVPDQMMTLVMKVPFTVAGRGFWDFTAVTQFPY